MVLYIEYVERKLGDPPTTELVRPAKRPYTSEPVSIFTYPHGPRVDSVAPHVWGMQR